MTLKKQKMKPEEVMIRAKLVDECKLRTEVWKIEKNKAAQEKKKSEKEAAQRILLEQREQQKEKERIMLQKKKDEKEKKRISKEAKAAETAKLQAIEKAKEEEAARLAALKKSQKAAAERRLQEKLLAEEKAKTASIKKQRLSLQKTQAVVKSEPVATADDNVEYKIELVAKKKRKLLTLPSSHSVEDILKKYGHKVVGPSCVAVMNGKRLQNMTLMKGIVGEEPYRIELMTRAEFTSFP